jgi:septal ring factor EnvC (AmiA/AmiB activator)
MIRLAVLAALFWTGTASAQSETAAAALAAKERLEMAGALMSGASESSDQIAALTETVRAYEDGLVALRDSLRRVAIEEQALRGALEERSDEVARLLGVLQMMDPETAPLLLLHPSGALGTARAGMILSDVTPALQSEVLDLRARLTALAELEAVQDSAAAVLAQGLDGAQEARASLAEAVSNRTDLPRRYSEDPAATALLVSSAETLAAFAAGLTEDPAADLSPQGSTADAVRGGLVLPVQGTVLRRAGEADAAGVVRPGIVIAARPRALVVAPATATIRFRGALLDYGNVIILEPAPDVLIVLAGLAEVFGETGQVIPAGSPIGLMGGAVAAVDEILTETAVSGGGAQSETLYLEVRDGQGPVDPADWFALE